MTPSRIVKAARNIASISQRELAERLGVATSSVSHWEQGRQAPDLATLDEVAESCGCRLVVKIARKNVIRVLAVTGMMLAVMAGCAGGRQSARVEATAQAEQDRPAVARVTAYWSFER